jgi:hypothetical protein
LAITSEEKRIVALTDLQLLNEDRDTPMVKKLDELVPDKEVEW